MSTRQARSPWLALLVALASACGRGGPAGRLTGIALLDGAPTHAGIFVSAAGPVTRSALTDGEGHYQLDELPDGDYLVVASAPSTREGTRVALASLRGEIGAVEDLHFAPLGIVRGSVTAGGLPSSGTVVTVVGTDRVAITDSDGRYRLEAVPIGARALLAASGALRASGSVTAEYAIEVEAPSLELAASTPAPTPSGELLGTAHLLGLSSHEGIVVTAVGPVSAATVTVASGAWTLTDLPDGHYTVTLSAPSTTEHTMTIGADLSGGTAVTLADVAFHPFGAIAGRATLDGTTTGNAGIAVFAEGGASIAFTADDGSYTLDGVPPGAHVVTATHVGFREARSAPVAVSYATTTDAPELDLSMGASPPDQRLTGHAMLVGLSDHSGTRVSIVGTSRSTTTTADGGYVIEGLEAGIYSLAFDQGDYHERVAKVLVLAGNEGAVADGGSLLRLDPLEIPRGRRILDLAERGYGTRITADSSHLIVTLGSGERWRAALDGSGASFLASIFGDLYAIAFAPDGRSMLYVRGEYPSQTYSAHLSSSAGDRELIPLTSELTFRAHDSRLAAVFANVLQVFDQTGDSMTIGPAAQRAPDFSTDGTQLAYLRSDGTPYVYSSATGAITPSPNGALSGAFSIDGVHIFCAVTQVNAPGFVHAAVPAPGGSEVCLEDERFLLFPAGGAYRAASNSGGGLDLWTPGGDVFGDAANLSPRPLALPDRVLYTKGIQLLSVLARDGTRETLSTNLATLNGWPAPPVVSPDGTHVLYLEVADSTTSGSGLLTINSVDGSSPQPLGRADYHPLGSTPPRYWIHADGARVVYESGTALVSQPVTGGAITTLVDGVDTIHDAGRTGSSPDGRRAWALGSQLHSTSSNASWLDADLGTLTSADPVDGTATVLIRHASLSLPSNGPVWVDDRTMVVSRRGSPFAFQDGIYLVRMP